MNYRSDRHHQKIESPHMNTRHYIFLGLLTALFLLCQLSSLHWLIQWIQDTIFNLFLIYTAWNCSYFICSFDFIPKERVSSRNRVVLITGCDSGFGLYLAEKLFKQDYHIFAGCLSLDSDGAKKLQKLDHQNNRILVVELDVVDDNSVQQAREKCEHYLRQNPDLSLWAIVNNAGIMSLNEVEFGDMKIFERQMEVNGLGVVRVTKKFLPLLRHNRFGNGRVINMASLAGRFTMPGFVGYCMSKSVVIALSDGLRRELSKWNIDVVSVEPHLFKTNLVNQERLMSEFEIIWNQTEESIRKDYGRSYFEGFIRTMSTAMDTARTEIDLVVDTMEKAVTLTQNNLEYDYVVARNSERIRIWFWRTIAPVSLIDFFMKKFLTDCNGQPKMLSNQQRDLNSSTIKSNSKIE